MRLLLTLCLMTLVLATVPGHTASAQTSFTVTTLADTTVGTASNCSSQVPGSSLDAACSLRDALVAAAAVNRAGGTMPVTVKFAASLAAVGNPGKVTLGATALALPTYTTVQGLTAGSGYSLTSLITIAGNGHPIFTTDASVMQSALQNLLLTNGAPALLNNGSIAVSQCTFAGNAYTSGGAIYNYGPLSVTASTFTGNSSSNYGGAIYSTGSDGGYAGTIVTTKNLTIADSTFSGNSSTDGGAVYIGRNSVGTIDSSTFTGNSAARDGGAVYLNNGSYLSRITNSILTGDTGGSECAGFGCDNAARGFLVGGGFPAGVSESGTFAVTITLSTGQVLTYSTPYGAFSTPESIASGFGGGLSIKFYPTLSAQSFGKTLLVVPGSATIDSIVFQNPSKYFTISPITDSILMGSGNVVSVGTAAANLAPLGSFGGPTQTVLPLPGSAALCTSVPASAAGTDQRGQPRTTTFATALCQDAGAVQTKYSLAFVQQPVTATVNAILVPAPAVQVLEGGQSLQQANAPVTVKDLSGALVGSTTAKTVASGVATFANLSVAKVQAQDTLTASLAVGANSVSVTSNPFDVVAPPTASLSGNSTFPLTALGASSSRVFTFTNTSTTAINITALAVTAAPEWMQTNTCGLTLAAGVSCAITVSFQPVIEGSRSGTLTLGSNASGYTQTVALTGTAVLPAFTLADNMSGGASTTITVAAGSSGTGVLKLASVNGFAGSVSLACVAQGTAPTGATCTVDSPVALTAGGSATATVTIATTARVLHAGLLLSRRVVPAFVWLLTVVLLAVSGVRSASRFARAGSLLLLLLSLGLSLTGCGRSVSAPATAVPSSPNPNGTAAGTYQYTVTATGGTLRATQSVTVTVQ